jgi:antitoxin component of MazEF toxin-antitoxin module
MVEIDIGTVKIQRRKGGSLLVTIPSAAVKILQIKGQEQMDVSIDVENASVIFKINKT